MKKYTSYTEAKKYATRYNIKSYAEWLHHSKIGNRPSNIPSVPKNIYVDEWVSWGDFLGNGNISNRKRVFRSFEEAKEHIQTLKIKTKTEYKFFVKSKLLPKDIPTNPQFTYKKDWISWNYFLGTPQRYNIKYRSFEEVKLFFKTNNIKTWNNWITFCKDGKKPDDIPRNIQSLYKNDWTYSGDFFETGRLKNGFKVFTTFNKSKKYVQKLNLKTQKEWKVYCKSGKKPENIPSNPDNKYKKDWISWGYFLRNN